MQLKRKRSIQKRKEEVQSCAAVKEDMDVRGLLFLVVLTVCALYTEAFKGDPSWVPPQGPCFNPPYPEPQYNDIELAAYWQVRFSVLVYKGKQWEDSGTTTRYSTLINHPELDAMAFDIAGHGCYKAPNSIPAAPSPCSACLNGSYILVSGITDYFSGNVMVNADCLFAAPNQFTYNSTTYSGNPSSVVKPADWSPEKWLGNPAMGMFSLNILCYSGPTVAYVLQYFWDNYRPVLTNPRHNWMGIGIHWENGTTPTYTITLLLVHMCHPAYNNYRETTLQNINTCRDVYSQLSDDPQYARCEVDYANPLDENDRTLWLWAGVSTIPIEASRIFCNGTQSWGGNNVTPMPMFYSAQGYPQICPPNQRWKSLEFTGFGFNTCSGGINSCFGGQESLPLPPL